MHRSTRVLLYSTTAVVGLATTVVGLAQPARAMTITSANATSWTWTDNQQPSTALVNPTGDAPVGSSRDAGDLKHTRRAYFTFDLTAYKGQVVHAASIYTRETSVVDCTRTAPVEVWRTKPVTAKTTWQSPPAQVELVAQRSLGKGTICPGAYVGVDVSQTVQAAIAAHEKTVTFEIRVAAASESDPKLGRTMVPLSLSVSANHVPVITQEALKYADRPCGTAVRHPAAGNTTTFSAVVTDPDPNQYLTMTYAVWPADHPDQRVEFPGYGGFPGTMSTSHDLSGYADGTVLAWSVRAADPDDTSPWARTCYLTVDNTAPKAAPVVSSKLYGTPDYPGSGGPGVAGRFTFDAVGDQDTVGFDYFIEELGLGQYAAAKHPGGKATISFAPKTWGDHTIQVRPVDAAGNRGSFVSYRFYVRNTAPSAEVTVAGVGLTSHITLYSSAPEVTQFGYAVDGAPETKVPAVNGQGSGDIVFTSKGYKNIVEKSYAGKKVIGTYTQQVQVSDSPVVTSDQFDYTTSPVAGAAGSFTFTPRTTNVVAYLYDFGDGQQRIDARADGTAVLNWTPQNGGYYDLTVSSVSADGTVSDPEQHPFYVIDAHPTVYSDAGQSSPRTDGVGVPVDVTMNSDLPGVTEFVYSFDGGPQQTVPFSGYTSVQVVPTHAGANPFTAQARLADGSLSPATTISIDISSGPLVSASGPFGQQAVTGLPGTITFKPGLPGVVSYRYGWNFDTTDEQTVAAAADGSATVTYTPTFGGYNILNVTSVGGDGTVSDRRDYQFIVSSPDVQVQADWSPYGASGGMGVPGRVGFFSDLRAATVEYDWHVNDGPAQVTPQATDQLVSYASYTPDRVGSNTLYVQSKYVDGTLSPVTEYQFLVGTLPLVESDVYQINGTGGGVGIPGTFQFSGGMPGIVSFDYQINNNDTGVEGPKQTVAADSDGRAEVTFTPAAAGAYVLIVTGHTADGTATDSRPMWFGVRSS